jgi:serine protease Do
MLVHLTRAVCVGLMLFSLAAAQTEDLIRLQQEAVRAAVAHVADSVVQIETLGGLERVGRVLIGSGPTSGLIVSDDGYLVSSAFNFIQQPTSILVTFPDGKRRPATIVARDRSRMLVLLKVNVDVPLSVPEPAAREEVQVGQTVIAVGKTFDPAQVNLSVGIVSATNRIWGKAIQTDANVSPANYGGPLLDLNGRVLGVLVPLSPESDEEVAGAEWYDSGIGFAVPLEDVNRHLERLKEGADLLPGKLGIALENANLLDPETKIAVVKVNSPAAQAGLQSGDRIVSINGHSVERHSHIRHQLGPLYAGDLVTLTIQRDDQTLELKATLTDAIPPYAHAFLGILPTRNDTQAGVGVRFVYPSSPASRLGLKVEDRVSELNGQAVESAEQLRGLLATHQPDQAVPLKWQRGDETLQGELQLGRLPDSVPDELPKIVSAEEAGELTTGKRPIEIPEEPNECTAYLPASLNQGHAGGLLIVLPKPGDIKVDELLEQWQPVCDAHDLVLLLPQPQMPERWQPTEAGYIRKVIDHAMNHFGVDDQRVAVVGHEAGGSMAYLVGFRQRDVVRGIAAIDAAVPGRLRGLENEPLQRLALLAGVSPSSPLRERVSADLKAFRALMFPVTELKRDQTTEELTSAERALIGRWVDNLDRL